ncbi:hypothetical protein [Geitlerinema calcuttense]|uniref:DUF2993 domain-containing protein n=1 Tax=Geitlerinema calcuttense NRMC-F 0142 TaxID=2922238 RepID=A0ABT7M2P1_9CYAN|nr:hypothetical protein [Geitlerinema calcuttense]MDL5057900.1 hypothetical protein [Geitlerinema calcuttense NRMC-F 0142]
MKQPSSKIFLSLGITLLVLAVVCGGLYFWGRHLLSENAGEYSRQVAEAEQEYVAQMIQWLQRPDDPRQSYDVEFFISAGVLEKIVEVLRGRSITLENGATLEIRALNLDLRDGFPLVRIEGAYHDGSSGLSFGGQAAAVLALEKKEDGFFFRVRPISFQPSLGVGAVRFALGGMLGSVSGMMVRDYAETWPGLRLPFERNIPVRVPSLEQEVIIKIGGKEGDPYVKTEFTFPKIETDLKVVYQGLLFTRSGIHLFADLEKQSGEADRPIVPSESWGQMSLQDKINALGFEGRDIGIRVSKRVLPLQWRGSMTCPWRINSSHCAAKAGSVIWLMAMSALCITRFGWPIPLPPMERCKLPQ